jgi:hypothetical protein
MYEETKPNRYRNNDYRSVITKNCYATTAQSNKLTRGTTEFGGVHIDARALLYINLIWFGLAITPIPVGRRGVCYSFK